MIANMRPAPRAGKASTAEAIPAVAGVIVEDIGSADTRRRVAFDGQISDQVQIVERGFGAVGCTWTAETAAAMLPPGPGRVVA